ncbi:hypothetical protein NDU88_005972 [Pleurodeles waltl]|uniref:Uncharacterized protein n=1 Tax=Pleurodeles waltl TaxID=8319 RepID=A0AAV7RL74_PLEWA|nr:hypothetical protein NDU88_005972 [Pleurodeles waltl]
MVGPPAWPPSTYTGSTQLESRRERVTLTSIQASLHGADYGSNKAQECDRPSLSSDPSYPWGTGRAELPDPEVLRAGTNPEELPGDDRKKRDSTFRPERAGGGDGEERDTEGEENNIGSGKGDGDGPADSVRAGGHRDHQLPSERREDQEAIPQ